MITLRKIFVRKTTISQPFNFFQSPKITYQASKIKFHQLEQPPENPNLEQYIHMIPEDNILSKFILDDKPKKYQPQSKPILSKAKNSKQVPRKVNYKQILSTKTHGSIITQQYKSAELCLAGMNYANVSYDYIYKSALKFQPDCILVQERPEYFCSTFDVIKKNPQTQVFSDKLYVDQLNLGKVYDIKKNLNEEKMKSLEDNLFPRKGAKTGSRNSLSEDFFPYLSKQIVREKPLLTSIYHSLKTTTPIYLCQLPQSVHRQWICNTHTLMQLQQMFKITVKSLPLYPGIKNLTPYQLAAYLFPDQFLAINDKYMATVVEIMIALGYKRIMMFGGAAENQAVRDVLKNGYHSDAEGNVDPLINYLVAEKVKGSIIRDYDSLELVEKHILFDTFYHGKELKTIKLSDFATTNKIIQHYAGNQPKEMIMKFRYDMSMKYSHLFEESLAEGESRKKKEFMRQAIRM